MRSVPARRREFELSVERPLGVESGGGGTVRWSVRFELGPEEERPSANELARELESLTAELHALLGPGLAGLPIGRPDRDLAELVDAYRPRQRELVDLLREEGALTAGEHARLLEYLAGAATAPGVAPSTPTEPERLLATVPIERPGAAPPSRPMPATGAPGEAPRPVEELLRTYQIASLRQAGAVRARRQISFSEYMALKRHFESAEKGGTAKGDGPSG